MATHPFVSVKPERRGDIKGFSLTLAPDVLGDPAARQTVAVSYVEDLDEETTAIVISTLLQAAEARGLLKVC